MNKILITIGTIVLILVVGLSLFFGVTPSGKAMWNDWFYDVQKADDETNYETIKKVEDTCRAMIASYEADKLTYEQYKNSEKEDEQSWASQAKMRANQTASNYNNYILQNTHVWKDNISSDIKMALPILE